VRPLNGCYYLLLKLTDSNLAAGRTRDRNARTISVWVLALCLLAGDVLHTEFGNGYLAENGGISTAHSVTSAQDCVLPGSNVQLGQRPAQKRPWNHFHEGPSAVLGYRLNSFSSEAGPLGRLHGSANFSQLRHLERLRGRAPPALI